MEHLGANMGIQIPLLVIGQRDVSVGRVCMVPEPVGSTHLRFGDTRVVMGIVYGVA